MTFAYLEEDPDAPDDGKVLVSGQLYDEETGELIDDEPKDTDEDDTTRSWDTDDDDAEEGMLDEQPDDLASDESRHDRKSYWGG